MTSILRCASCGRTNGKDSSGVKTIKDHEIIWCTSCADVKQTKNGRSYVSMPSPGRMYAGYDNDPIGAWEDCYLKKPKKRILVSKGRNSKGLGTMGRR